MRFAARSYGPISHNTLLAWDLTKQELVVEHLSDDGWLSGPRSILAEGVGLSPHWVEPPFLMIGSWLWSAGSSARISRDGRRRQQLPLLDDTCFGWSQGGLGVLADGRSVFFAGPKQLWLIDPGEAWDRDQSVEIGELLPLHEMLLVEAARRGETRFVQMRLDQGARIDVVSAENRSPLILAAMGGHTATATKLLDRGANIEQPGPLGDTALIEASRAGLPIMVRLLLDRGAVPDAANRLGFTPLMEAARHGHASVVELLLRKGASPSLRALGHLSEVHQPTAMDLARVHRYREILYLLEQAEKE